MVNIYTNYNYFRIIIGCCYLEMFFLFAFGDHKTVSTISRLVNDHCLTITFNMVLNLHKIIECTVRVIRYHAI